MELIAVIMALLHAALVIGLALAMVAGLFYATHICMQIERRWGPPLNRWIDQKD